MRLPPLEGGSSAIIALGHVAHGVQAGQHLHDMDAMTGATSWGMLAAHAIAALLCGRWLACGERAAFQILRAVADRFHIPPRLLLPAGVLDHWWTVAVRRRSAAWAGGPQVGLPPGRPWTPASPMWMPPRARSTAQPRARRRVAVSGLGR